MSCPLCQSLGKERIYRLCSNMKILGSNFPDREAHLAMCENCGLVYCDTEATQKDFLAYYTSIAKSPAYYDMFGYDETEHYFQHILQVLKKYISFESKILDVASSWGELAKYVLDHGYSDIRLLDPCEACVHAAAQKGLNVIQTDSIVMGSALQEQYDMIIFNHTLEHILDLCKTMHNARSLLKDDGYIFIEIPDAEEYENQNSSPFNYLTYEHVLHMTAYDIENLANYYGFQIVECEKYYKKVSAYPSVYAVFTKSHKTRPIRYSPVGRDAVKRYIDKCKKSLHIMTEPYEASGEPLILWGVGASTAILLEAFSNCNVVALIDSNPMRQGLVFSIGAKNLMIGDSNTVKDDDGTIFILSTAYHDSIAKQIRDMGLRNKIVSPSI